MYHWCSHLDMWMLCVSLMLIFVPVEAWNIIGAHFWICGCFVYR